MTPPGLLIYIGPATVAALAAVGIELWRRRRRRRRARNVNPACSDAGEQLSQSGTERPKDS